MGLVHSWIWDTCSQDQSGLLFSVAFNCMPSSQNVFLFFVGLLLSPLCSSWYPGTLVRSFFPSPLLCTGNPNDQDESRGGILRPYPARENAPSCGLNNAAISTSDSGQQTFAESQVSPEDPLGPLPENWEMAYTESGELYFIEYVSGAVLHANIAKLVCPHLQKEVTPPDRPHLCMLILPPVNDRVVQQQKAGPHSWITVASPVSLAFVAPLCQRAPAVLCELAGERAALAHSPWLLFIWVCAAEMFICPNCFLAATTQRPRRGWILG